MKKIKTSAYMPTDIEVESVSQNHVKITAHPFESGFAVTLAHPLRRLLYSSTVGFAPTAVKIEGASHEFDSMRGMLEDVALFIINLKNIRFKIKSDANKVVVNYTFTGPKEIRGIDLNNSDIEVVTPDGYLATLNEDAELTFSLVIERGIGYVPSESTRDSAETDYIALDAFFTPVKKAVYEIENVLVEDNPNFEKIIFTIVTDGLVTPVEAFKNALNAMYSQMSIFNGLVDMDVSSKAEGGASSVEVAKLLQSVEELNLSARSFNCLDRAGVKVVGELALMDETEMKELKNLGKKSLEEIKAVMEEIGFPVGTTFSSETVETVKKRISEIKSEATEE
ncbi:MAG: DNA-directed RNA polymerase subunit alpha [Campylobacterales bacterium]|nr:DNA-directed RNA polymerase subunit alpha [Campylobacterales bacterium]